MKRTLAFASHDRSLGLAPAKWVKLCSRIRSVEASTPMESGIASPKAACHSDLGLDNTFLPDLMATGEASLTTSPNLCVQR